MAERIEALGMLRVGMEKDRARRVRSVWVVALCNLSQHFFVIVMSDF
jgi:hypothetical protein